jgi:peptidyl-prolyl cis-trans isomerase SurA
LNGNPELRLVAKLNDSSYQFIRVKAIVQPEPKSLKEAKGFVVSDYQEYLEKKWLAELTRALSNCPEQRSIQLVNQEIN